jgi:hypothetical protein
MPQLVVFDALGTLFELEPVRAKLVEIGAPPAALEAWFERILHTALTLTTVGDFRPFREIAESTLQTTLAQLDLDASRAHEVLERLQALEPYDDARVALELLATSGVRRVTLTNGGGEQMTTLSHEQACSDTSSASSASRRFAPTRDRASEGNHLVAVGDQTADARVLLVLVEQGDVGSLHLCAHAECGGAVGARPGHSASKRSWYLCSALPSSGIHFVPAPSKTIVTSSPDSSNSCAVTSAFAIRPMPSRLSVSARTTSAAFAIAALVRAVALFGADAPNHRIGQRRLRRRLERPERAQPVHRRHQRLQDRPATTARAQVPRHPPAQRLGELALDVVGEQFPCLLT